MSPGSLGQAAGLESLVEMLRRRLGERRSVEALALLLAAKHHAPIGRPRLSRILGFGDRKTRNLIRVLHGLGLLVQTRAGVAPSREAASSLEPVRIESLDGRTACSLPVAPETARLYASRVVEARDRLAILLGDSSALLLLGYCDGEAARAPGVPPGLLAGYLEERMGDLCGGGESRVWGLFARGGCYLCCAALIHVSMTFSGSTLGV